MYAGLPTFFLIYHDFYSLMILRLRTFGITDRTFYKKHELVKCDDIRDFQKVSKTR